jgi:chemotaxis protein methyltransferase CheR
MRERLAERIRAEYGLDPPGWLLDARIHDRARARSLGDQAYLELAAAEHPAGEAEREALAALLRVGETRFFRHRAQLHAVSRHVLPERAALAALGKRPLRVWSAGCASGEEAYTLAMLLDGLDTAWSLLATDLSAEAIASARAARYPSDRVGDVPDDQRAKHLVQEEGSWLVRPTLRQQVRFERHNLRDAAWPSGFDLILCRNVLIYFEPTARQQVLHKLADALLDGGYLFLGYSETLRDQESLFEALHHPDVVLYRKRGEAKASTPRLTFTATPAKNVDVEVDVEVDVNVSVSLDDPPPILRLQGDYLDGTRLAEELRPVVSRPGAVIELDGATFLDDSAARVLRRARQAAPGLMLRATRPAVRRWLLKHGLSWIGHE